MRIGVMLRHYDQHQGGVRVYPASVESIDAGIERVLDDDATRTRLAAAGRVRSEAFRWSRCARETLAALERVAR